MRLEAIAIWLEAIAIRLEAISIGLEAIASNWKPLLLGGHRYSMLEVFALRVGGHPD